MTALTDTRPHVFMEILVGAEYALSEAQSAGLLLTDILDAYPDIDLPTVRVWRHSEDGVPTIRIDARRGELVAPTVECPQCHQAAGRPHTDYCTLSPDAVWSDQL